MKVVDFDTPPKIYNKGCMNLNTKIWKIERKEKENVNADFPITVQLINSSLIHGEITSEPLQNVLS